MSRESMVPPNSGAPYRPGQDCPNCGAALTKGADSRRKCPAGCGYRDPVRP